MASPVTIDVEFVPTRDVLEILLKPRGLTFAVRGGDVVISARASTPR